MKKTVDALFSFLETKTGFLILGFLVTTVGGSILNSQIQQKTLENEHTFEMYKVRLSEAKDLQKNLLQNSTARFFYLHQVLTQLAHPENHPREEVEAYWKTNVTPATEKWNKELNYLHAQTKVLFSPQLSDMLRVYEENKPIVHNPVISKIDQREYEQTIPKTLHGALMDAHATVHFLLWKCNFDEKCDQTRLNSLNELAEKQINYLTLAESCFAYRISAELLRYPYGPMASSAVQMPDQCKRFALERKQKS